MEWLDPILPTRGQRIEQGQNVSLAWRPGNTKGRPRAAVSMGKKVMEALGWAHPVRVTMRLSTDGTAIRLDVAKSLDANAGWSLHRKDNVGSLNLPMPWVISAVRVAQHVRHEVAGPALIVHLPDWAQNTSVAGGGQAGIPKRGITEAPLGDEPASAVAATPAEIPAPRATEARVAPGTAPLSPPPPGITKPNKWTAARKDRLRALWPEPLTINEIGDELNALPGDVIPRDHILVYGLSVLKLPSRSTAQKATATPPAPPPPAPANDIIVHREPHHAPLKNLTDEEEARNLWFGGMSARDIAEDTGIALGTISNWIAAWRAEKHAAENGAAA